MRGRFIVPKVVPVIALGLVLATTLTVLHLTKSSHSDFPRPYKGDNDSLSAAEWYDMYKKAFREVENAAEATRSFNGKRFPYHIIRFYDGPPSKPSGEYYFTECISILSVLLNFQPDWIYYHTNYPDFWPFDPCNELITEGMWPEVKVVYTPRVFQVGGKRMRHLHHQSDYARQKIMHKYGGAYFDQDVYIINGIEIKKALEDHECFVTREGKEWLNAGVIACNKGAKWPRRMLESYHDSYYDTWLFNSALLPWQIYVNEQWDRRVYADRTFSCDPDGDHKDDMLFADKKVKWWDKIGYHSFYHNRDLSNYSLYNGADTSFKYMLRWILDKRLDFTILPNDTRYAHFYRL